MILVDQGITKTPQWVLHATSLKSIKKIVGFQRNTQTNVQKKLDVLLWSSSGWETVEYEQINFQTLVI